MERDEIVKELNILRDKQSDLRKKLDLLDENDRYEQSKKYLGKVYKHKEFSDCIYYTYIYDICSITKEPIGIELFKSFDDDELSFTISHTRDFNPRRWNEDDKYEEISRDLFTSQMIKTLQVISSHIV